MSVRDFYININSQNYKKLWNPGNPRRSIHRVLSWNILFTGLEFSRSRRMMVINSSALTRMVSCFVLFYDLFRFYPFLLMYFHLQRLLYLLFWFIVAIFFVFAICFVYFSAFCFQFSWCYIPPPGGTGLYLCFFISLLLSNIFSVTLLWWVAIVFVLYIIFLGNRLLNKEVELLYML